MSAERVLTALSGGVDSAAAALLLKESGAGCEGAVMRLFSGGDIERARLTAAALDIPFHVFDVRDAFDKDVIRPFITAYRAGKTPNPCILCNGRMKFGQFRANARRLGFDRIATGHYARTELENGRYILKKGLDPDKDQSYVLYTLTQEQLAAAVFPLGGMTKAQVRELAASLPAARAKESQDICFIPDGDYAGFIERASGEAFPPGRFLGPDGRVLGRHRGIVHYTVGQRRGLGVAYDKPLYVKEIRAEDNTVILGAEESLYTKTLAVAGINLIALETLKKPLRAAVKIRYRHPEQPAEVTQIDGDTLRIGFDSPQRAVTPGQAAVIYDGDVVIGGGTII